MRRKILFQIQKTLPVAALAFALLLPGVSKAQLREIEHIWGQTQIEGVPERIVSLSFNGADNWLALGIVPYAYRVWYGGDETGLWPWAAGHLDGQSPLQLRGEIDIEAVARLQPDLIEAMYSGLTRAEYRALSRIAPVIGPPPGSGDFEADWRQMLTTFASAAGREAEAERIITAIEADMARLGEVITGLTGSSAVIAMPSGPLVLTSEDARMRFLIGIGFVAHDAAEALSYGGFFYRMDPELRAPLEPDLLLWLDLGFGMEQVLQNPLRNTLRSVAEGREAVADPELSAALSYASALSLPYALQRLEPMLAQALDGDPVTPVSSAVAAGLAQ